MKRLLIAAAGLVSLVALAALGWATREVYRQSTRDEAQPADAIVVLGAAEYRGKPSPVLRARLEHALALYTQGLAPMIVTTGGSGEGSRFTEAEAGRDYLVRHGVPSENIVLETEGTTTLQSIAAVAEILDRMNLKSCIVVSDGYHVFRAKKMLEVHGLNVYGSPRHGGGSDPWLYIRQAAGIWLWVLNLSR
jgi:uncharacterized SAM-binding protein YcdF (DUF218 family)